MKKNRCLDVELKNKITFVLGVGKRTAICLILYPHIT